MKKSMCIKLFFSFTFMIFALFSCYNGWSQTVHTKDIDTILQRFRQLESLDFPSNETVQKLMHSMQSNGSWKGIDYQNTSVHWSAAHHLTDYVFPMAKAYANKQSSFYKNKKLDQALHKSLDFWLDHNFTSQNWWANDIGVPNALTDIMILMQGEITQKELLQALNQMRGTYIDQTGQNRVWRAGIQLKIGLLEFGRGRTNMLGSPEGRIKNASETLQEEVQVRDKEGIQPDWSFHQHGVQQQFGNYGLSFASTQAQWVWLLRGTPFHYSQAKVAILRNYILNGLSSVVWKGTMDISGCGRQLFPNAPEEKGRSVINVLQLMSKADPEYAGMYQSRINELQGKNAATSPFDKNIYFWRSDLMVNRTSKDYISVRMCSKKIQSTESGNGENLLGAHLSDGATYIYQSGKEYKNIFPVWNWYRIPGVTSYVQTPLPKLSWSGLHNESDFVGGVSDSSLGIAAMLFKRNGLSAHKSWFFVPPGLVCLGAGIHSDKSTDVSTTLNQALLNGNIIVKTNEGKETIADGHQLNSQEINWVYHDHTGYAFLQKNKIHVSADNQKGNWKRVYDNGSQEPVIRKVFNLWIDHGNSPANESYAYIILPNINEDSLAYFVRHPSLNILQNDTTLQAVQYPSKDLTQAVFYCVGKINLNENTVLQTNAPCMLMIKRLHGALELTISVPPELEKEVILSISGHYKGINCHYHADKNQTNIIFNLPDGIYAGKSVTRILQSS